jgi:acyl-CoA synthetase (AMP-forming)/AMP-acid ligase II/NAD(P)-dependent dehydrogenase (short-subunit alcohol dehydrogenase family)
MSESDSSAWPRPPFLTRVLSWVVNPGGAPSPARLRAAVAGKTVLITGASSGIGEATAHLLAAAGARVLLVARSRDRLDQVAAAVRARGGAAEVHPADLADAAAVVALGRHLLETYGPIDVVVSNAGKSIRRSVALQYDRFHDFERTIGVNYLGPVRLLLALLPAMRQRRSGQVVDVSTFGVRVSPGPRWGAYQASKAAFDTWFRSMGVEARTDGVTTTSIYMPLVYTPMSAPTPSLRGLPGLYPAEAAGLVARAIVRRPRSIAPWWLLPAELASVLLRRPVEWAMGHYFRRTTDSPAAIGTQAGGTSPKAVAASPADPPAPSLRRALRKVGLMTRDPRTLARMARAILLEGGRPSSLCALAAARTPHHPAVADDDGMVTYEELHLRVRKLAAALRGRYDVGPTRGLAVMCRNHRAFIEVLLAGSAAGADVVLLNTDFPGPQLAQALAHHRLGCVVHDPEFGPAVRQSGYAGDRVVTGTSEDELSVDDLIRSAGRGRRPRGRQGRIVILTSGTTGVPRGAGRTPRYRALAGPLITLLTKTPVRVGTVVLISTPLFHGFGLAYLAQSLLLGATIVVRRRPTPEELLAAVARHRVEVLVAVPTTLKRLLDLPEPARAAHDLSSLKAVLSSGAPLGGDLGTRFMAAFGPCLYNLYGSSETGFGAIATPADLAAAPGTVGYPPVGTAVRLLGPDGRPVPAGRVGRVFLQTGLAFAGYVGGGDKERIDGYVSTGDLGHVDEAGRLFIDGRADDMIVSGGENVFPLEVEEVLAGHPAVAEAVVIGVADGPFGQRLKAFVVTRAGEAVGEDALRDYLKDRVARFKVPREFVFLPRLPRNAAGKVLKRDLGPPGG